MMITNLDDWNQNKITINCIKNLFQPKDEVLNNAQINATDLLATN